MITKITKEQQAKIPKYVKKWIDLASQPIDRNKSKSIIKTVYNEDKTVIFGESLENIINLILFVTNGKKLEQDSQLYSQLGSQLYSQLDSQLYSQLDSQLYFQLKSQLKSQLDSQLYSQLKSQLYSQLYFQLDSQLYSQLHSQLGSQLNSQLGSQLNSQLKSQLDSQLDSQLKSQLKSQLGSQNIKWNNYSSYYLYDWAGYYDFAKMMGVKFNEDELKQFNDILLNVPIIVFVGNILFICEKPKCEWENNLLHSIVKPAVNWADGTGIFFLEGIKFEKDLWEKIVNKTIPAKELLTLPNQDQKIVALKTYGWKKLLNEIKPKILDEQNIIINGELLNHQVLEVNQDGWIGRFLKFTDPADKDEGLLRVDHKLDETKTVLGARKYGFLPLMKLVGAQDFEFGLEG